MIGSIDGGLLLGLTVGVLALNYLAIALVISKAGYSWVWIILPLTPFALFVACIADLYRDLHTLAFGGSYGFVGLSSIGVLWKAFLISLAVNWIMFFVFAFTRWPTANSKTPKTPRSSRASKAEAAAASVTQGFSPAEMSTRTSKRFPAGGPGFKTNAAAGPTESADDGAVATTPSATRTVAVKRCVWCGESLPGSRALFHDCGPTDRPPAYCATCGNGLAASGQCSNCDAPVSAG